MTHLLADKIKSTSRFLVKCLGMEITGIEPVTSCMPCKRSPERYRNTPPTRKCGDRLNIALIRSIHKKGSQLHPASRNRATSTRHFTTQFSSVSMGFAQKEGHLREKIFSNSLLSAILILSQDLKVVAGKLGQPQYLLQISSGSPPSDLYHEHDRRL